MSKFVWSESDVINANYRRKSHIEQMSLGLIKYYADEHKHDRKAKRLCRYCHYINTSRIGGSAITTKMCSADGCNANMTFGNTCTDVFCEECADKLKLCKHCGAKMD